MSGKMNTLFTKPLFGEKNGMALDRLNYRQPNGDGKYEKMRYLCSFVHRATNYISVGMGRSHRSRCMEAMVIVVSIRHTV